MATFFAHAPRFSPSAMQRTDGNSERIIAVVPSELALSTTIVSKYPCATPQARRFPMVLRSTFLRLCVEIAKVTIGLARLTALIRLLGGPHRFGTEGCRGWWDQNRSCMGF